MARSYEEPLPAAPRRRPPRKATTPEARERQLTAAAIDLAERQIQKGTASAQVITHYLKLGTTRETLERDKLRQENELLKARVKQLASMERIEELYSEALNAMRRYSGREVEEEFDD